MNLIEACTEARKQHKAVCRKIEEYKYLLYPTRDICAGDAFMEQQKLLGSTLGAGLRRPCQ